MLYNSTRELLLQANEGYTSMIADALFLLNFKPRQQFNVQQAIEALKPLETPVKIIRAGLYGSIFQRRGRRNMIFTMPEPNEARKAVGASVLKIRDNLPAAAFKSLKAYRMALHHALIKRRPGKYTRGLLARRLNVCKQTTRNYDVECGHKITPQHNTTPLTASELDTLPALKIKGCRRRRWLAKLDSEHFIDKYAPLVKAIALQWLKSGAKVVILEQTSNLYEAADILNYATGELSAFIQS